MKITVTFDDTGVEEEHDFDSEPREGELATLTRDGQGKDYVILSVSGYIHGETGYPTTARVRLA